MNSHCNQLVCFRMEVTETLQLLNELGRYAMNAKRNEFIPIERVAKAFQRLDEFRGDSVYPKSDQFFIRRPRVLGPQIATDE